ncbi:MAG TPA: methylated-DNA--[protein]-cysteine S-methyltransferase [Candidatus Hydrogenedentes bacterium]|nr:methylated-DNA--[protein]-cysteine S-methyltransferase [Candidatus Hydrogenedentota bacterium]
MPIVTTDQPATFRFDHARGPVYGWFSSKGLWRLELPHAERGATRHNVLHAGANDGRVWQLNECLERYFAGVAESFSQIPLDMRGATPFQQEVWNAAIRVGWGASSTYGELAESMGKPKTASRAVGAALGQNPVAILIPCHRFIGKNGALHGFAAGLEWKRELLRLEGILLH